MKKYIAASALAVCGSLAATALPVLDPVNAAPVTHAQSSLPSSSLPSSSLPSSSNSRPNNPTRPAPGVSDGLTVELIGDLLGEGISDAVGFYTGDLGIMREFGEGEEFAIVFGDSWRGAGFGEGEWMSPVGVVAVKDADGRIKILRPLNDDDQVEQLIDYSHDGGITLIPSDVLNIDGTLYMQGMWNQGIGNVKGTQIWKSEDNGASWQTVSTTEPNYKKGLLNLISWERGDDGYVYMVSSEFKRSHDVYLTRFLPEDIDDNSQWQHLNPKTGQWEGSNASLQPILSDQVQAGEMSLRYIDGHWVLAMFNRERLAIEVRISQELATDWNQVRVADVVTNGPWFAKQTPNNFSQLYGGYIVPGSTLGNMDLVVSQWNTKDNSRYNSTQFNVKGLDKFFGITPETNHRSRMAPQDAGNAEVLEVEQAPAMDTQMRSPNPEGLSPEGLTIVPLED